MEKAAAQMAGLVAETFGWSLGTSWPADRMLDALEDCSRLCAAG
jgi:hypothetical protein